MLAGELLDGGFDGVGLRQAVSLAVGGEHRVGLIVKPDRDGAHGGSWDGRKYYGR